MASTILFIPFLMREKLTLAAIFRYNTQINIYNVIFPYTISQRKEYRTPYVQKTSLIQPQSNTQLK